MARELWDRNHGGLFDVGVNYSFRALVTQAEQMRLPLMQGCKGFFYGTLMMC